MFYLINFSYQINFLFLSEVNNTPSVTSVDFSQYICERQSKLLSLIFLWIIRNHKKDDFRISSSALGYTL